MAEAFLVAQDCIKSFNAIRPSPVFSFNDCKGEIFGPAGPNGAGKDDHDSYSVYSIGSRCRRCYNRRLFYPEKTRRKYAA